MFASVVEVGWLWAASGDETLLVFFFDLVDFVRLLICGMIYFGDFWSTPKGEAEIGVAFNLCLELTVSVDGKPRVTVAGHI